VVAGDDSLTSQKAEGRAGTVVAGRDSDAKKENKSNKRPREASGVTPEAKRPQPDTQRARRRDGGPLAKKKFSYADIENTDSTTTCQRSAKKKTTR